jgi:hypothetical protein
MSCVIDFIKNNSLDRLCEEYHIRISYHDKYPLIVLCYDEFRSPKDCNIASSCYGLVIDTDTYSIVSSTMKRIPYINENINDFDISIKEDGIMINVFYYNNEFIVSTKHDFGEGLNFFEIFNNEYTQCLNKELTYCFELCSSSNRIVIEYFCPQIYFLGAFKGGVEVVIEHSFNTPVQFKCSTIQDAKKFLDLYSTINPLFEGFILIKDNMKYKMKSQVYLIVREMKYRGYRMCIPHNLKIIFEKCPMYIDDIINVFPERLREKYKMRFDYCRDITDWKYNDAFIDYDHGKLYCNKSLTTPIDDGLAKIKPYLDENNKFIVHCYCGNVMTLTKLNNDFIFEKKCCNSLIDFLVYPCGVYIYFCDSCEMMHQCNQNSVLRGHPLGYPCSESCENLRLHVQQLLKSQKKNNDLINILSMNSFECIELISKMTR